MSRRQKGGARGEQYDFSNLDNIKISDSERIITAIKNYDLVLGNTNLDEVISNYIKNYKTDISEALNRAFFTKLESNMKIYSPLLRAINNVLKRGNLHNKIKDFNEENIGILIRKIKEITTKLELEISESIRVCHEKANGYLRDFHQSFSEQKKEKFRSEFTCGIRKKILDVEQPFVQGDKETLPLGLKPKEFDLSPIIFKRRCDYLKKTERGCATLK